MTTYAWILFALSAVYFLFLLPVALKAKLLRGLYSLFIISIPLFYFANHLFFHLSFESINLSQLMLYYSVAISVVSLFSFKRGGWINLLFFLPQIPFCVMQVYPNLLSGIFN